MKTLYVSDLDGTLLNSRAQVSQYSLKIINALIEKGTTFTYATARSLLSAARVTTGLEATCPVIVYNGAFIMDPCTKEIIHDNFFNENDKSYIINLISENKISPLVYAFIEGIERVSWLLGMENDGMKRYLVSRQGDRRLNPIYDINDLYKGNIFYFTCIGHKEELLPLYNSLQDNPALISFLHRDPYLGDYWCEAMHKDSTKANAVLKVKEMLNCQKIVSFGDALNDMPLFEVADESYAVENAINELKNIATDIIPGNNEDGVARFLVQRLKRKRVSK